MSKRPFRGEEKTSLERSVFHATGSCIDMNSFKSVRSPVWRSYDQRFVHAAPYLGGTYSVTKVSLPSARKIGKWLVSSSAMMARALVPSADISQIDLPS